MNDSWALLTFFILPFDPLLNLFNPFFFCLFEPIVLVWDWTEHHQIDCWVHEDDYDMKSEKHLRQKRNLSLPARKDVIFTVEPKLI